MFLRITWIYTNLSLCVCAFQRFPGCFSYLTFPLEISVKNCRKFEKKGKEKGVKSAGPVVFEHKILEKKFDVQKLDGPVMLYFLHRYILFM